MLEEAKFFGITSIINQLEDMVKNREPPKDHSPITRREFIKMLKGAPTNCELRCQVRLGCPILKLRTKHLDMFSGVKIILPLMVHNHTAYFQSENMSF